MDIKYKYLFELDNSEINELMIILSNKETMKWIKNGKPWTIDYINDLIKYSKEDYDNNFKNIEYVYLCVILNNKVIGFCGLHPMIKIKSTINGLQILIIVHPEYRGKGISKLMIEKLLKFNNIFLHKNIYSLVSISNIPSNKSLGKYKSTKQQVIIKNKKFYMYELNKSNNNSN
jgi:RimJ/RimL family protein N-acetyltransferase